MHKFFSLLILSFCLAGTTQAEHLYRLYLKDKSGSVKYALSEKSHNRRTSQGIALDDTDLEISPTYIADLTDRKYKIVLKSRWMNTVIIRNADGTEIDTTTLLDLPYVAKVDIVSQTEAIMAKSKKVSSHTPLLLPTQGIEGGSSNFRTPIYEVRGDALIDNGYQGAGKMIAILDGGFFMANTLQHTKGRIVGCHDMLRSSDQKTLYNDGDGAHGTFCLSIMSCNPDLGVWGTAQQADFFLIRTENATQESPMEEDSWIAGAEYADSIGADIISSSVNWTTFPREEDSHTTENLPTLNDFISQATDIATRKGMLICNSAGNLGAKPWHMLSYPANVPGVLTIGATTPDLETASLSGRGWTTPYVKPDVCARGETAYFYNPAGWIQRGNGTSLSCPLVAGLCASLWSAVPELTAAMLIDVVRRSASQYDTPDADMGYGIPDFEKALKMAREMTEGTNIKITETDHPSPITSPYFYDLQGRITTRTVNNKIYIDSQGHKKIGVHN